MDVQIYDSSNKVSSVETGYFSVGLPINHQTGKAEWIGIAEGQSNQMNQFRTQFQSHQTLHISLAQCYIACPGYYTAFLNRIHWMIMHWDILPHSRKSIL